MAAYYNEIDPYAAQWLRNLIAAGLIAPGDVDERDIRDVRPGDIRGYTQCHFFAGIGVWSYALRLAGWPDDRPVWTGSCPCQPFSAAGRGKGFADERHLWPHFHWLIAQCRPPVVFGEQVASKDGLGWWDVVSADLEGTGYTSGAVDTCAAGFGAPHIRQRLYWVAYADDARLEGWCEPRRERAIERAVGAGGVAGGLADADGRQLAGQSILRGVERDGQNARRPEGSGSAPACRDHDGLADAESERWNGRESSSWAARRDCFEDSGDIDRLADAEHDGRGRSQGNPAKPHSDGSHIGIPDGGHLALEGQPPTGPTNGHWRDADWLFCRDGKWRPVEPGTFPLAHGASPHRGGRLRAYGNAIVAQAAQAFIESYLDINTLDLDAAVAPTRRRYHLTSLSIFS